MEFNIGDVIEYKGNDFVITKFLGSGGQGVVYEIVSKNESFAFKYYKKMPTIDFKNNLRANILKKSPSNNFIWPKHYIEFDDINCGYIMDLIPNSYDSFMLYLRGQKNFKNKKTMIHWCIELINSLKLLHDQNFIYQDLNPGSLFVNYDTGDLLICDNDNISPNGKILGILGKTPYIAPEIISEKINPKNNYVYTPDIWTDRFALAIVLFNTLCRGNPFEGLKIKNYSCVDSTLEKELYGTNPIYIFDKHDDSNRPIKGYQSSIIKNFDLLPNYIKDAFQKSFVDGINNRSKSRLNEDDWLLLFKKYEKALI